MFSDLPAIYEYRSVVGATTNIFPLGNLLDQFSNKLCSRIVIYYDKVHSVNRERTQYSAEKKCTLV